MATALEEMRDTVLETVEDVRAYLASPEGQRLRNTVAAALVAAAPFVSRMPFMRMSRLGRLIGMAGGTAVIIKVAELIRDWEGKPETAGPPLD